MPFLTQPSQGNLARLFNVLGCTLEENQLRHCAAKPIVQLAIIANKLVFTPRLKHAWSSTPSIQGPTEYELDALPTEPLSSFSHLGIVPKIYHYGMKITFLKILYVSMFLYRWLCLTFIEFASQENRQCNL